MSDTEISEGPEETFEFEPDTLEETSAEQAIDVAAVDNSFGANLAIALDSDVLRDIGLQRQEVYTNLKNSRGDWEDRIKRGIRWLGLSSDKSTDNEVETCTAVHPLLMENVVKFQAKAAQELWPASGPVRTKIKGFVNPQREQAAARVRTYMNYQLTEQVPGFYSDLERNLFRVAFMGVGLRKAGWNPAVRAPDPAIVNIENFFVDPAVTHLKHADEHIELLELSGRAFEAYTQSGRFFCDTEEEECEERLEPSEISEALQEAQGFDSTLDRLGFLVGESHCYLDLDGLDTFAPAEALSPYIVHFNIKSGRVYSIRRNWREADAFRSKRLWYTVDNFIPAFGFYSLGFVHLIGDLTAASSAALQSLVDSGQFANWQAGFKSKDAKFSESDTPLRFGEWRDVNASPEDLQNSFLPLPAKEPSQTLFALLQFMVASGQKFADATDEVVQNATNYGPAATTLALLEASQRFYSSIHKRLHQSQQEFFKLLAELNFENLPATVRFVVNDENQFVQASDFDPDTVAVIPASDPNALSESQRVAKAQIEVEMAARFPQLHNMQEALRRFYSAMGTDAPEKLLMDPAQQAVAADPLTEIKLVMSGKPIKADIGQDHGAHITVKEAFLQSPQMQGTNDPTVAVGSAALKANVSEHKVLIFISQVMAMAQQAGLPAQDPQVQALISQKLVAMSAESGQSPQSTEDKMMQLQARELDIAAKRIESQDSRESAGLALKLRELDLKFEELKADQAHKNKQLEVQSASKILDNNAEMAQIEVKQLADRTS